MFQPSKELTDLPQVKTPNQQLANAIRRGCVKVPVQCRGELYEYGQDLQVIAACALGAALEGGFYIKDIALGLVSEITFKNDRLRWTREQIADWLDTL